MLNGRDFQTPSRVAGCSTAWVEKAFVLSDCFFYLPRSLNMGSVLVPSAYIPLGSECLCNGLTHKGKFVGVCVRACQYHHWRFSMYTVVRTAPVQWFGRHIGGVRIFSWPQLFPTRTKERESEVGGRYIRHASRLKRQSSLDAFQTRHLRPPFSQRDDNPLYSIFLK